MAPRMVIAAILWILARRLATPMDPLWGLSSSCLKMGLIHTLAAYVTRGTTTAWNSCRMSQVGIPQEDLDSRCIRRVYCVPLPSA